MAPSAVSPTQEATLPTVNMKKLASSNYVIEDDGKEMECHVESICRGGNMSLLIPSFTSFHEHRKHIVVHMAAVFRNWARQGYTEGISGHISVRDPEYSDYIWMNPIGKHFALLDGKDMVCIRISDGEFVGGNRTRPINNAGYYIHSEIHKARPDVHAICHAHTIAGRAWCAFGKPLDMITQDVCDLYGVLTVDSEYTALATAQQEGQQIARALGTKGRAALLMNHGIVTVGTTVDEASFLLGLVDRSCDIQLRVEAACAGNPELKKKIIPHELALNNFKMAGEKNWLYMEGQPDIELEIELAGSRISDGLEDLSVDAM
ncbi:class II aldolase/adducin N-terminal [Stachybotrys elegans]|uniref:Class II aldolase/adducin N-terminal n=1 Tax=Stachybotrys elegans TaxID=80388 RepID=A0A8K0WVL1_9HYPO|nr:class II aldolase/adducin N-terminal [Stachybotrys elegans]